MGYTGQKLDLTLTVTPDSSPSAGDYDLLLYESHGFPYVTGKIAPKIALVDYITTVTSSVIVPDWDEFYCSSHPGCGEPECSFGLQMDTNGVQVSRNKCLFISSEPQMPNLVVRPINPPGGNLRWELQVSYNRCGVDLDETYETTLSSDVPWTLRNAIGGDFAGGNAVLTCHNDQANCAVSIPFNIRAYNPPSLTVSNYIQSLTNRLWYWLPIATHESDSLHQGRYYAQFNTEHVDEFECSDWNIVYTPNLANNCDGGVGIFNLRIFGGIGPRTAQRHGRGNRTFSAALSG